MIVNDTPARVKQLRQQKREAQRQQLINYANHHLSQATLVQRGQVAHDEHQMGRPMWPHELEQKLKTLNPKFHFERHPLADRDSRYKNIRCLFFVKPDGTKEYVLAYHQTPMPEYSVFHLEEKDIPDPDFWNSFDRKVTSDMLRPGEWKKKPDGGVDWYPDTSKPAPGFKRIVEGFGEKIRGWRTVVAKLVQQGYITPTDAVRVFDHSDRAAWVNHIGQRKVETSW